MTEDFKKAEETGSAPSHRVQSHSIVIPAPPAKCYETIIDFDTYLDWSPRMESVRVVDRYPDGKARRVEFVLDIFVKKARYILEYKYDDANFILSWNYVEGDVDDAVGDFKFENYGDGQTYAQYSLDIKIGFYIPEKIQEILAGRTMRDALRKFKEEVLKRA